jgi:hypothetical protein
MFKKYYVIIENGKFSSLINYLPAVPEGVIVKEIEESDAEKIYSGSHYFDVSSMSIKEDSEYLIKLKKQKHKDFLKKTDWKVLRHIREKALYLKTSLTEEEYLNLEKERHLASKEI